MRIPTGRVQGCAKEIRLPPKSNSPAGQDINVTCNSGSNQIQTSPSQTQITSPHTKYRVVHVCEKRLFRKLGAFQHHVLLKPWTLENTDDCSSHRQFYRLRICTVLCLVLSTVLQALTLLTAWLPYQDTEQPLKQLLETSSHIIFRNMINTSILTSFLSYRNNDFKITSVMSFFLLCNVQIFFTTQSLCLSDNIAYIYSFKEEKKERWIEIQVQYLLRVLKKMPG